MPIRTDSIEYSWERARFRDLEHELTAEEANVLCRELGARLSLYISLVLVEGPDEAGRLAGATCSGVLPMLGRASRIELYRPYLARTIGHEFAHALRWRRDGKRGHGDTWRDDLTMVHGLLRRILARTLCRRTRADRQEMAFADKSGGATLVTADHA